MFCYVTNIPKDYNNFYQNQCYFVSSEIFSLSFNNAKYLMQHKLLLRGISVLLKRDRAHVVVGTFVKRNGYDGKQQMLLLQIIFYGSSAILIIKNMLYRWQKQRETTFFLIMFYWAIVPFNFGKLSADRRTKITHLGNKL
jgi:hypothetical protein